MFKEIESYAMPVHESTSQIVDDLIEFILKSYYAIQDRALDLVRHAVNRDRPEQVSVEVQTNGQKVQTKQVAVELQINGQTVYAKQGQDETINQLTQSDLSQLKDAFEHPELVEGSVSILVDGKPVLLIEDGQVLQDDLGITQSQNQSLSSSLEAEQNLETERLIAQAESEQDAEYEREEYQDESINPSLEAEESSETLIAQAGSALIANYGYGVSEDISAYHGQTYSYEQNNESMSIHAYGRGAVFKDGEFTSIATDSDRQNLSQLPEKVEQQLSQDRQQQRQQQTRTPLRLSVGK